MYDSAKVLDSELSISLKQVDYEKYLFSDKITIYAYPTLVDENGGEFITIFSLDKDGNIVPEISKEEVKAKLASNEYSII